MFHSYESMVGIFAIRSGHKLNNTEVDKTNLNPY
jgi:hypothetical protein